MKFFCWFVVLFHLAVAITTMSFTLSRGRSFYSPLTKSSRNVDTSKLSVIKEPQSKLSSGTGKFRKFECEQCGKIRLCLFCPFTGPSPTTTDTIQAGNTTKKKDTKTGPSPSSPFLTYSYCCDPEATILSTPTLTLPSYLPLTLTLPPNLTPTQVSRTLSKCFHSFRPS